MYKQPADSREGTTTQTGEEVVVVKEKLIWVGPKVHTNISRRSHSQKTSNQQGIQTDRHIFEWYEKE